MGVFFDLQREHFHISAYSSVGEICLNAFTCKVIIIN
jgi:hypothetical protein